MSSIASILQLHFLLSGWMPHTNGYQLPLLKSLAGCQIQYNIVVGDRFQPSALATGLMRVTRGSSTPDPHPAKQRIFQLQETK